MTDIWHKSQYEEAMRVAGLEKGAYPEWDDLEETKRANIRQINIKSKQFFDDLGESLRSGGSLPHPFDPKYD